jgi:hypothetical protein
MCVGLEINSEKSNYMIMSRHPNSRQNQNIRVANELFENVATFKYFGTSLITENVIPDKIKRRLMSGNTLYHSETTWPHLNNSTGKKHV